MPLSLRYFIVLIVLLSTFLPESNAQRRRKPKIWEGFSVTGRLGANHFYGDLVDDGRTNISLGFTAEKELNTFLSARASIMGGQMSGSQIAGDKSDPNLIYAYFDNIYTEFNGGVTFRPLNIMLGYYKQRSFNPYVIGQVGLIYYNASEYFGNGNNQGATDGSLWREKNGISAAISGGFGLSYWINSQWSINVEAIGTIPTTDELDGHSEWSPPPPSDVVYKTEANDFYYTTSIGITFLIDDSRWKNEPKYNRKAYLKTRSQYKSGSKRNLKSVNRKRRKKR